MAPNLVSNSRLHDPFSSSSTSAARPTSLRIKSRVRTHFVVTNIFYHLLEDYVCEEQQTELTASNPSETEVLETFKKVVNEFKVSYSDRVVDLCSHLEVTTDSVNGVFLGVSNELFSEGITWGRISALFVFSSELAAQCLRKELPDTIVEEILGCCLELVQDKLENWIEDHGGWEGIINFSKGQKSAETPQTNGAQSPGWAKSMLHGTVRVLGTLAHIANTTGQMMAVPLHNARI